MDKNLVLNSQYVRDSNCPSHSIGHYIGTMRNNTDCDQLTEEDLTSAMQVKLTTINFTSETQFLMRHILPWHSPNFSKFYL